MVAVPAVEPAVTTPDVLPILAMVGSLLLHSPPEVASLSVLLAPTQALSVPVIADGVGATVTIVVARQPVEVTV